MSSTASRSRSSPPRLSMLRLTRRTGQQLAASLASRFGMTGIIRLWPLRLLVGLANSGTAVAEEGRRWTLEDVVTVPAEFELSLASDGKSLAYLERRADLQKNETVSILHLFDLRSRASREILRAASAEQLRPLPNGTGWSLLLDRGDELQLYALDAEGTIKPLMVRDAKVTVGQTEGTDRQSTRLNS